MHAVNQLLPLAAIDSAEIVRWVIWSGLVVLTVSLLVLIRTRWGQSQPLSKCVVLSLLAHLLLGIYFTTVTIVTAPVGSPEGSGISVALVSSDGGMDQARSQPDPAQSWPGAASSSLDASEYAVDLPPAALPPENTDADDSLRKSLDLTPVPLPLAAAALPDARQEVDAPRMAAVERNTAKTAEPLETADEAVEPLDIAPLIPPPDASETAPQVAAEKPSAAASGESGQPSSAGSGTAAASGGSAVPALLEGAALGVVGAAALPGPLQRRVGDHLQLGKGQGVSPESEAAVRAALAWLASQQTTNGHWSARQLGAGGLAADHEFRNYAGAHADTGITGLALLAFLAAGNTHLKGEYADNVRRGLEFLMTAQSADGCMGATTNRYERMYCHAMATCAVSEALAMSSDQRLSPTVKKAIGYTLRAQDRSSGGWRYDPGSPGDTSQLGWQVMSLKSAELAGITIPQATRDGIARFLQSVSAGRAGGQAVYQPDRNKATRSMTAEAMVCRQFLGVRVTPESTQEATSFLLQEVPGVSTTNHYYWYYATLGLFQTQGDAWRRWNESLQKNLLASQRQDGKLSGSWDPDPVWGPCGGRVYSTALSTLCLEVSYRFLPLYVETADQAKNRK